MSIFTYTNTKSPSPTMSLCEFVARGYGQAGDKMHYMSGYNADIDGAVTETVWPVGATHAFMTAAAHLDIVSTTTVDSDALNTGAQTVQLTYLDDDFVEHTAIYSMNGQTDVLTATDVYRVNDFRVVSGTAADGTITLERHGGTTTQGSIPAGATKCTQLVYTVPDGYDLQLSAIAISASGTAAKSYLKYTLMSNYSDIDEEINGIFYPMMQIAVEGGAYVYTMPTPILFPEHTDIYMNVIGNAATDTCEACASWRGMLTANS